MPQLYQVLRCYKCLVFQVYQIKKSNKWECKICCEKQSVKRHYGLGTAKDCRLHVQKLNGIRGEVDEIKRNETDTDDEIESEQSESNIPETQLKIESKWKNFVEEIIPPVLDNSSSMFLNNTEVVLELPQKRKRVLGNKYKNKINKSFTTNEEIDEVPQISEREESLCSEISYIQDSELELNNIKNKTIKCSQYNESIDSVKANYNNGKYFSEKPETTLSIESSYSSMKKGFNSNEQVVNKFKPPSINKNSKWAQFADEEEQEEPPEEIENDTSPCLEQFWEEPEKCEDFDKAMVNLVSPHIELSQNMSHALFALCDDVDMDNVLDL